MPYIMNALDRKVATITQGGKHFTWKPLEIKMFHSANIVSFIAMHRGEEGLVEIPDHVMELDKNSAEYKDFIEQRRREGIFKRIEKLDFIRKNLMGSLRFDIDTKGMKVDPLTFATRGELEAMKELSNLKEYERKEHTNTADEIRKVLGEIDGNSDSTDAGTVNTGSADTAKAAQSRK